MILDDYNNILNFVNNDFKTYKEQCVLYSVKFSNETLTSIYTQCWNRFERQNYSHRHSSEKKMEYYNQYLEAKTANQTDFHIIINLAKNNAMSPALFARIIIEMYLQDCHITTNTPMRKRVTELMKEPWLIEDPLLSRNVSSCLLEDINYGPIAETIKRVSGNDYELKLVSILRGKNLTFFTECDLRKRGYDKTPDVKLEIPFAIASNNFIVNWIDSKASFGDPESFKQNMEEQYSCYCNRFGPGLVIYWNGFVNELNVHVKNGLFLMDSFPENIVIMS